ncbi:hypothetical protein [Ramlibacter montanisoli]|uniref:hypothetical protein n=1 Tax=Ramlibacter montanisoli TaxID=2732512 RepID=UPI002814C90F|nr:hypothetical protein [Ramlibacter montanisoli]
MGALIRTFDWSTTPLGPLAGWPQSLKTAVSLILRAQQPMFIGWGPDYISSTTTGTSRSSAPSIRRRSAIRWPRCGARSGTSCGR